MDFDSSSKFISSLAKFLQSLCNGYVEFDNGVEVIGHIYLNVDTGKKIDYVLNEKVCKTDENSVTFISNSFHAQPAEKPKPVEKVKPKSPPQVQENPDDGDLILMDEADSSYSEQFSDNVHNVQHNSNPHPKPPRPHGASKRSYNQSFSSHRPSSKAAKFDSSTNPNGAHQHSNNTANDSSFNVSGNISVASESDLSHLSQVFPEGDPSNSQDKDIKPVLDKDMNVINVKQEYDPQLDEQGDGNTYDPNDASYYSQDQSYDGNEYYGGGHRNSRSEYDLAASKMYLEGGASSGSTGDTTTDIGFGLTPKDQGSLGIMPLWYPGKNCPVPACNAIVGAQMPRHWMEKHRPVTLVHHCALCRTMTKRRSKLLCHIRSKHGLNRPEEGVGTIEQVPNKQFIDPSPLTLDGIRYSTMGACNIDDE